jgi:hypothetical protein
MITYAFRISCRTSDNSFPLEPAEQVVNLPGAPPIQVRSRKTEHQPGVSFVVWCKGLHTRDDAQALGARVKNAIRLSGLLLNAGIDVGRDEVVSQAAKRADGTNDERLQPDVHGLQIVPDVENLRFGFIRFGGRERKPYSPSEFQDKVRESYQVADRLTKRQELAAQLYSEGYFQSSNAARLIVLVSAIETLAEPPLRSEKSIEFISSVVAAIPDADLEQDDRQRLVNALGNLQRQSISSTCTALVARHADPEQIDAFATAYRTRSSMLHTGEVPPEDDLDKTVLVLDQIVKRVIIGHIVATLQTSDGG